MNSLLSYWSIVNRHNEYWKQGFKYHHQETALAGHRNWPEWPVIVAVLAENTKHGLKETQQRHYCNGIDIVS